MHLGNWKPERFVSEFSEILMTADEVFAVEQLLNEKHGAKRNARQFYVFTGYRAPWVGVEVLLRSLDQKFYYPVQVVAEYKKSGSTKKEIANLLLDFVDLYYSQFFAEEDTLVPIDWSEFDCEGLKLFMRGQIRNRKLEQEADSLLGVQTEPAISPKSDLH